MLRRLLAALNVMCRTCESEKRDIWTYLKIPEIPDIKVANWISLKKCSECNALWCEVPYEPYASFKFLVKWPYGLEQFNYVSQIDNALILHEWHGAFIRENWQSLSRQETDAINQWRERTYMSHNPIDKDFNEKPLKYLYHSKSIQDYVQ